MPRGESNDRASRQAYSRSMKSRVATIRNALQSQEHKNVFYGICEDRKQAWTRVHAGQQASGTLMRQAFYTKNPYFISVVAEAFYASKHRCTICWEDITKDLGLVTCGHVYHSSCLADWRKQHTSCPQCRGEIAASALQVIEHKSNAETPGVGGGAQGRDLVPLPTGEEQGQDAQGVADQTQE